MQDRAGTRAHTHTHTRRKREGEREGGGKREKDSHTLTHDQRHGWMIMDYVCQLRGTHDIVYITEMCSCLA